MSKVMGAATMNFMELSEATCAGSVRNLYSPKKEVTDLTKEIQAKK